MSASRQAIRGKAAQAQQLVDGAVAELAKWTEAGLLRPEHDAVVDAGARGRDVGGAQPLQLLLVPAQRLALRRNGSAVLVRKPYARCGRLGSGGRGAPAS